MSSFLVILSLLLFAGRSTAFEKVVVAEQPRPLERSLEDDRDLGVYALYNLDQFSVRFTTTRSAELDRAVSSIALSKESRGDIGAAWMLISETGGLESSLSYPIRSVTQDFLYIGFQNLIDDWILELNGGPDGNTNGSYQNNEGDGNNRVRFRLLKKEADSPKEKPDSSIGEVVNIDGGDSTGEQDYNTESWSKYNASVTGAQIEVVEEKAPTGEIGEDTVRNQQETEIPQIQSTLVPTSPSSSSLSIEQEPTPVQTSIENDPLIEEEEKLESYQTESRPASEEQPQIESDPSRESQAPLKTVSHYVNVYEGLVYHTMYEHLVTVDLRVKLYLRRNGFSDDEDSLRRNLRNPSDATGMDDTGMVELFAEMTPTVAFMEPVSETQRLNKPSNDDVKEVFGVYMEYLFGKQRDVYVRTLREYEYQDLLQQITALKVDVGTSASTSVSSSNTSGTTYSGIWSERTQNILLSMLILLGVIAVLWPLYTYVNHVKKHREITLQLMNGGLSLNGGDEYDFSERSDNSFSSVTYRDNFHDMVKLPPINQSVPGPDSSMPRPQGMSMAQRANSMDAVRHGGDIFPSKDRDVSQNIALSALQASDRYLSRHRPDLFYDQKSPETKAVNVFGRVYEIPSNPFDFIYKCAEKHPDEFAENPPPSNAGMDLGRGAHFPFSSPRSSFTAPALNKPYIARTTSVGSTGNNSTGSANHFKPIVEPNQNLAARNSADDDEGRDEASRIAAHTGHSWQNNDNFMSSHHVPPNYYGEEGGGVVGNIFRNLGRSSWYNGSNVENSYTANSNDNTFSNPSTPGGTSEVYYDNYHHQHQDPSIFQSEIELESLPNDEDPANYNFAFQDFPRKDGTPCMIVDDDSFLSERKRRESAKMIFAVGEKAVKDNGDDGSLSEKKLEDLPVSDEAFKMMLSQNALDIDNSLLKLDDDDLMVLPPLEGSFLNKDPNDAKSPEFQQKLSRLFETKRQRYTQEKKNEAIVAEKRRKRKNARERERVDRHKAIERELEDIEAEFSLTMQPLSPNRNKNTNTNIHGSNTPNRNTHSPKPPKRNGHSPKPSTLGPRYSPMPSRRAPSPARRNIATLSPPRRAPSPARRNIATLSPPRSTLSNISASSPGRSNMLRGVGRNNSMGSRSPPRSTLSNISASSPGRSMPRRGVGRNNSLGGHRKQNSLGQSPFRKFSPRARYPNQSQGGVSRSASHRSVSPPDDLGDVDGATPDYEMKFRSTNTYGADRFAGPQGVGSGSRYDDLSLPSMTNGGEKDAKFRSPQDVIDEALQSGGQISMQKQRHYPQPVRHHKRSLTPSRMTSMPSSSSGQQMYTSRRTNSFDVNDISYQSGTSYSTSASSQLQQHPVIHQSPSVKSNGNISHRRARSGSIGSSHKRANSRDEDIFLHGVVAQTRFV
jgi:hypothetical protein